MDIQIWHIHIIAGHILKSFNDWFVWPAVNTLLPLMEVIFVMGGNRLWGKRTGVVAVLSYPILGLYNFSVFATLGCQFLYLCLFSQAREDLCLSARQVWGSRKLTSLGPPLSQWLLRGGVQILQVPWLSWEKSKACDFTQFSRIFLRD